MDQWGRSRERDEAVKVSHFVPLQTSWQTRDCPLNGVSGPTRRRGRRGRHLIQQPHRAPQPGDPPPHRRRRHLPHPHRDRPPRRRRPGRADRRMGRRTPLPRPRGPRPLPRHRRPFHRPRDRNRCPPRTDRLTTTRRTQRYTTNGDLAPWRESPVLRHPRPDGRPELPAGAGGARARASRRSRRTLPGLARRPAPLSGCPPPLGRAEGKSGRARRTCPSGTPPSSL